MRRAGIGSGQRKAAPGDEAGKGVSGEEPANPLPGQIVPRESCSLAAEIRKARWLAR